MDPVIIDSEAIYPEMQFYGAGLEALCDEIAVSGISKERYAQLIIECNDYALEALDIDPRKLTGALRPVSDAGLESMTASVLQFMPTTYAEEEKGVVTVSGLPTRLLVNRMYKLWSTNRVANNIFNKQGMRYFQFYSFFAIEVIYLLEAVLKLPNVSASKPTIRKAIQAIREETWVKNIDNRELKKLFDYSQLDELKLTLKSYQREYLEVYEVNTQRYNLNGYVLAAAPGSGKTLSGYAMSLVCGADVTLIISPNNAVDDVWYNTHQTQFKHPDRYPIWTSHMSKGPTGNERYLVVHYDYLPKLPAILKMFRNKTFCVWVDESHNFSDINAARTKLFIEIVKGLDTVTITYASGTPWKAVGKEVVPVMRVIANDFTPKVEERFIKIFGASKGAALELLANRLGLVTFKVETHEAISNGVVNYVQNVQFKGMEKYLLSNIRTIIQSFINERKAFYGPRKAEYEARYFACIEAAKLSMTERELLELKVYLAGTNKLHYYFDPRNDGELVKECKAFEREHIIPNLSNADKKEFRHVSSVYKYVDLTIKGEALGRILTRMRIDCFVDMIPHANLPDIIKSARKKTLILTSYVEVADGIVDYLKEYKFEPQVVYGATNANLNGILRQFKTDPNCNPMVATFDSLSTAVPVVEASTIVLYNSPFREYIRKQSIARLDRLGQDGEVIVADIVLDTGEDVNISSRSVDILAWSKENVDKMMGLDPNTDAMEKIALERYDGGNGLFKAASKFFGSVFNKIKKPDMDLYHISFDGNLPSILKPQVPAGSIEGEGELDEPMIPRTCFSETLEGCFRAVYPNIQEIAEKHGTDGLEFHIYKPKITPKTLTKSPESLVAEHYVHDALVTREWWVLNDVEVEHVGKVVYYVDTESEFLEYVPFNDSRYKVEEHSPLVIRIEE